MAHRDAPPPDMRAVTLPWWRRWRATLLAAFALVALVVGVAQLAGINRAYRRTEVAVLTSQAEIAAALATATELFAARYAAVARDAARALSEHSLPRDARHRLLASLREDHPEIGVVAVTDAAGIAVDTHPPERTGLDLSDRSYFRALQSGAASVVVSDLLLGKQTRQPEVAVAAGSRRPDGAFLGMVVFGFPIANLEATLTPHLSGGAYAVVVDRTGRVIILRRSGQDLDWEERDWSRVPPVADVLAGQPSRSTSFSDPLTGEPVLGTMVSVPGLGWAVGVFQPREAALAPARQERRAALATTAAVLGMGVVLTVVLGQWLSRPVVAIAAGVAAITAGDLTRRVCVRGRGELAWLAGHINAMAARLAEALRQEQALTDELTVANEELRANAAQMEKTIGELEAAQARIQELNSELVAANEGLRESEARLRLALDAGQMGAWHWDVGTGKVTWSPALEAIHGLPPGAFAGTFDAYQAEIHPEDRGLVMDSIRRALEEGADYDVEYRIVHPDGTVGWVAGKGRALHDGKGRVTAMTGTCMDITGRKRAEIERAELLAREQAARAEAEAARAEAQRVNAELAAANRNLQHRVAELQTLLDVIPIGIALAHDAGCRTITGNPAFERMLGMPPGRNLSKSAPPGEEPPFRLYQGGRELSAEELPMQMAAARGVSVSNVELDVVWPDGTTRKLLEWAAPVFDEAGRVRGSWLAVVDITERKRVEEALRASETRYRLAARAANDVIRDWNLLTGEVAWNEALQTVLGYTPGEAGITIEQAWPWWIDHVHPEDRERIMAGLQAAIDGGQEVWSAEYRLRRADGSYAVVVDRAYIARDEQGRPIRAVGSILDVTARQQAEDRQRFLAEAGAVLASALDYEATLARVAQLAVPRFADLCVVDLQEPDGQSRHVAFAHADPVSEALAARLRCYPPHECHPVAKVLHTGHPEVISRVTDDLLVAAGHDAEHLDLLRSVGVQSFISVPLVARGRTLGAISLMTAESGRRYGTVDLPLAEELARRAALAIDNARLYQEAQEAIRARDIFLARASHELRTPLTSALASIRLLKHALAGRLRQAPGELLEMASRNMAAMLTLINDLLDASKLAAGQTPLDLERVALADIVLASKEVVEALAQEKGVVLRSSVPSSLTLQADPLRLVQVVTNLLANAVKFTPAGGDVVVEAEADQGNIVIRVRDTGEGIATEHLERIFEPFAQAGNSRRYGARGTGLGLAICRQIVTLHGGRIRAESEGPGKGSTFVVTLPRTQDNSCAA